ncbi:MAG: polyisoprenyl-teichoic acid--peptidoglycan teichoic acid transferase [Actinomycetota bacterium]|jgi:LCP family protein required for cell wall assembly
MKPRRERAWLAQGSLLRRRVSYAAVLLVAAVLIGTGIVATKPDHKSIVIGKYDPTTTSSTPPTVTVPIPDLGGTTIPAPRHRSGGTPLLSANGQKYGPPIPFHSSIADKSGLVFMVIVGSDARPGEDLHKTRTDSLHVVAIDPAIKSGTVIGIPRDTYVEIPGRGTHKINEAMERGGPQLMMQTLRNFTGLPLDYYVLTAFEGFAHIVDELDGVDVYVPRAMDDDFSGAHFEQGYHHFNGEQALAFSRDRHDVPYSDFSRSLNQGSLMLAALGKMRSEVGDDDGLHHWLGVLANDAEIDIAASELDPLAALARRTSPERLNNVVMPGKTGSAAGGQSVVYATDAAYAMWADVKDDALLTGSATASNPGDDNGDNGGSATTQPEDTTTIPDETTTSTTRGPIFGGGTTTTTPD